MKTENEILFDTIQDPTIKVSHKMKLIKNGGVSVQRLALHAVDEDSAVFYYLSVIISGELIDEAIEKFTKPHKSKNFAVFSLFGNKYLTKKQFLALLKYVTPNSLETYGAKSYGEIPNVLPKYLILFVEHLEKIKYKDWMQTKFPKNQFLMLLILMSKSREVEKFVHSRLFDIEEYLNNIDTLYEFWSNTSEKTNYFSMLVYFLELCKRYDYKSDLSNIKIHKIL